MLQSAYAIADVFESHLYLVRRIANRLSTRLPACVDVDDLVQVGLIGLNEAMLRFEQTHGCSLETFASQRIQGAMLDELRRYDPLPRSTRRRLRQTEEKSNHLAHQLGRRPRDGELAAALQLSMPELTELSARHDEFHHILAEDARHPHETAVDWMERNCADHASDCLSLLEYKRMQQALVQAIEELSTREQFILSAHYEQDMKLKDIAAALGLGQPRISQILTACIKKLHGRIRRA